MHRVSGLFRSKDKAGVGVPPPPYTADPTQLSQQSGSNGDAKVDFYTNQHLESPTPANDSKPAPIQPDEIVTIHIGPEYKVYRVSKCQIREESIWIRDLLRPGKSAAESNVITIDQQDSRIWDMIVTWLDTKQIPDGFHDAGLFENSGGYPEQIATFYQTAWRLQMAGLKNDIMDATRRLWGAKGWSFVPQSVWNVKTLEMINTPIYQFYLDTMVWDMMQLPKNWLSDDLLRINGLEEMYRNHELTVLVTKHILKFRLEPWGDPRIGSQCAYHDHSDGCKNYRR